LKTGRLRAVHRVTPGEYADNAGLAFSSDGRQLAFAVAGRDAGEARLWDVVGGGERGRWKLPPGLQNKLAFDGPGRLWHFQVELDSGRSLPDNLAGWRQHPRVCRIRNLKAADPAAVVAEIADFNAHVFQAFPAGDGHFVIEGKGGPAGDRRAVKIVEAATRRVTWSVENPQTLPYGRLRVSPTGKTL
jgi:hypothetical protein